MAEITKPGLIKTIKHYMKEGDEQSARNYYENYKERFKITESLEQLIQTKKKKIKEE